MGRIVWFVAIPVTIRRNLGFTRVLKFEFPAQGEQVPGAARGQSAPPVGVCVRGGRLQAGLGGARPGGGRRRRGGPRRSRAWKVEMGPNQDSMTQCLEFIGKFHGLKSLKKPEFEFNS